MKSSIDTLKNDMQCIQITLRLDMELIGKLDSIAQFVHSNYPSIPLRGLQQIIRYTINEQYRHILEFQNFNIDEYITAFKLPQKMSEKKNRNRRLKNGKKDNNIHDIR